MEVELRKGKLLVSSELYKSDDFNLYLECLKIKVFKIDFLPFDNMYEIFITSPFFNLESNSIECKKYNIELIENGIRFVEVKEK